MRFRKHGKRKLDWNQQKKTRTAPNSRGEIANCAPGDYLRIDCGCIVRYLRPNDHRWTWKPLSVTDATDCTLRWPEEPRPVHFAEHGLELSGAWKVGVPGGKKHYPGLLLFDTPDTVVMRLSTDELRETWMKEAACL